MKFHKLPLILAAFSIASLPVMASAQNAAPASVTRSSASQSDESELDSQGMIIVGLTAAAVIGAIILATDNDHDTPVSP